MKVNSIPKQSFGAIPSVAIRKELVKQITKGKDLDELLGLIKEIYPYKYMTMIQDGEKVHWIGLTDKFDKVPYVERYVRVKGKRVLHTPIKRSDFLSENTYASFKADEEKWLKTHPLEYVIKDNDSFITLFEKSAGEKFSEITGALTTKLKKLKAAMTPEERAWDKVNSAFDEYIDIQRRQDLAQLQHSQYLIGPRYPKI